MLPTIRQLQYLKLLAEQGAFGKAAEAAHVTQPTLSAGIQELERTLGAPVVDRARTGVILTPVGEEALRRATVILNEAEELVEAAKNAGKPLSGRFRMGVIPTIAPFLLPAKLPGLKQWPSEANMVLVRVPDATKTFEGMKARGVLIKNVSKMHPLLANCLRLTVGTADDNARMLAALESSL
jgi:DNA-binding transcriptional LysR family regulator